MNTIKVTAIALMGAGAALAPATADAGRSHFGFSINSGPAYVAPAPVYYAPPPPPPVVYRPAYVYPRPYYRPAPGFSFTYHGY